MRNQRPLTFRTHTERRTLNPVFNEKWLVSGIPSAGFTLSLNLIDEDPGNHDDRLGKGVHTFPSPGQQLVDEWSSGMIECKVHKRKGSLKSKFLTYGARIMTRGNVDHHCRIQLSVKVLGRARDQKDPRVYTLGPRKSYLCFTYLSQILFSPCQSATFSISRQYSGFFLVRQRLQTPTKGILR